MRKYGGVLVLLKHMLAYMITAKHMFLSYFDDVTLTIPDVDSMLIYSHDIQNSDLDSAF